MNGKGDKSRVRDFKQYRENFEAIKWKPKPDPYRRLIPTILEVWNKKRSR